jgi:uncharacterized membrane protein YbhN (UPF0104 family)
MKKVIIYIILAALLVIFIYRTDFDFSRILNMDLNDFILLSAVILISYINSFFAIKVQFAMLDVFESKTNIALLTLASNILNYLPAKGGMLSLGTFLKVKKKVPFNKFVFTTMLIYILVTAVTLLMSLFFIFDDKMLFFYNKINFPFVILFCLIAAVLVYISYKIAKSNRDNKLSQYYILFVSNRKLINKNKMNLFFTVLTIIGGITLFSARMYISFGIAGSEISVYHAFLIGIIANLSFFLSFTPGGLGVKEGFVAGISYLLFADAGIGVVASLIDRAVNLLLTLITGIISIKILDKRFF